MMEARTLNDTESFVFDALRNNGYFASDKWLRPMDIGRPSSFICRGLQGLERKGMVESKTRSRGVRGSKLYRLAEGFRS